MDEVIINKKASILELTRSYDYSDSIALGEYSAGIRDKL